MNPELIYKAIKFAEEKHKGQVRKKSGIDYVSHPIVTSYILSNFKKSKNLGDLIAAAILHDTLEDTDTNFLEIAEEFSPLVASLVLELTSPEEEIKKLGKNEYLKKKIIGISSYGLVLKLCDRLANIMDNPKESYIIDTIDMMKYILKNRKCSKTQRLIIHEILKVCIEKNNELGNVPRGQRRHTQGR